MNMNSEKEAKRGIWSDNGNCFLYGCGISFVVIILIVVGSTVAIRYSVGQIRDTYTDVQPIELPIVDLSEEEKEALLTQVDEYYEELREGTATEPLILNQNDLNGIIQYHPEFENLSDKVYFTLNDDKVSGEISVPLNDIPMFANRYFNGTAEFDASFENGIGKIFVLNATVKGEAVPDSVLNEVGNDNLAGDMQRDPETQEVMENIDTIEIIDGRIIITPKNADNSTEITLP